jgi:putative ABC transport system substrate-binding protein
MGRRSLLALLLLLGALGAGPAAAAGRPVLDWLQYDPEQLRGWDLVRNPQDSARQTLTPRWAEGRTLHHVLLLVPIRSVDAYSISVNTILAVFRDRDLPTAFEVWFYDQDPAIAAEALAWAEKSRQDLIITVGSLATEYVHAHYRGGAIPVVTSASKDPVLMGQVPDYGSGSGTNIAYTSINVSTETELAYLLRLIPELHEIAVIYAENNKSAVQTQVKPLEAAAGRHGLSVHHVKVRDEAHAVEDITNGLPLVMAALRSADPDLRRSILLVTGSTSVYDQIGLINRYTGRLPVIATLPDVVRPGSDSAVLSIGVNQSTAVQIAALYAIAILTGQARAGDLKVGVAAPPDIAISFRRAREIGLRIPFDFFEAATFVYDYQGRQVRAFGQRVATAAQ